MKRTLLLLLSLVPLLSPAEPFGAALVVQNHASAEFDKPLSEIADEFLACLSESDLFDIVLHDDVLDEDLNRDTESPEQSGMSATGLGGNLRVPFLITAAIGETSVKGFGVPAVFQTVRMKCTLSLKKVPSGTTVVSVTQSAESEELTPAELDQNGESVYSDLVAKLAKKTTKAFFAECKRKRAKIVPERVGKVAIGFGCFLPGADVKVDGLSRGTAPTVGQPPLRVLLPTGIHTVEISYPDTVPFKTQALVEEESTFIVLLPPTEEGRRKKMQDRYYDLLLERIQSSGMTDDEVRRLRATGYKAYLERSYTRIRGIPQILSLRDCEMPDFGLDPDKDGDGVGTPTNDLLDKAGAAAGLEVPGRSESPKDGGDESEPRSRRGEDGARSRDDRRGEDGREPPDNTDAGAAMPLSQPQQATPVQPQQTVPIQPQQTAPAQPSYAPASQYAPQSAPQPQPAPPQNQALQNLRDIREGVETGKDIVQGIKDIGNLLK